MMQDLSWQEQARCAVDDPLILEIFFNDEDDEIDNTQVAISICEACPVRRKCLKFALDTEERFGVWGGSDEVVRRWALSVDQYGKPIQRVRSMTCPDIECSSQNLSDIEVETTRSKTRIRCDDCGLTWWSRKTSKIIPVTEDDLLSDV